MTQKYEPIARKTAEEMIRAFSLAIEHTENHQTKEHLSRLIERLKQLENNSTSGAVTVPEQPLQKPQNSENIAHLAQQEKDAEKQIENELDREIQTVKNSIGIVISVNNLYEDLKRTILTHSEKETYFKTIHDKITKLDEFMKQIDSNKCNELDKLLKLIQKNSPTLIDKRNAHLDVIKDKKAILKSVKLKIMSILSRDIKNLKEFTKRKYAESWYGVGTYINRNNTEDKKVLNKNILKLGIKFAEIEKENSAINMKDLKTLSTTIKSLGEITHSPEEHQALINYNDLLIEYCIISDIFIAIISIYQSINRGKNVENDSILIKVIDNLRKYVELTNTPTLKQKITSYAGFFVKFYEVIVQTEK